MKSGLRLIRVFSVMLGVMIIVAACAPMPVVPPGAQTPTVTVYLPGVEQPGIATSPLQPPAAITETAPLAPTVAVPPSETPRPTIVGEAWQWVSSTFKDGTVLTPGDPARYTFQLLPDGNALVQADCNFGTATYQETAAGFSFGPIGTTKMACPPDSLDSEFLGQIRNIERHQINDDGLTIYLLDEAGVMEFRAGEAAPLEGAPSTPGAPVELPTVAPTPTAPIVSVAPTPTLPPSTVAPTPTSPAQPTPQTVQATGLEGTSWVLQSLWVNGQAIPPVQDTVVTLDVAADGIRISGSTGCNQYRAMLTTDIAAATVTAPALMTRKACAANVMVLEVEFIDALLRTSAYAISGDELALTASDGEPLMVLVRK